MIMPEDNSRRSIDQFLQDYEGDEEIAYKAANAVLAALAQLNIPAKSQTAACGVAIGILMSKNIRPEGYGFVADSLRVMAIATAFRELEEPKH